MIRTVAPALLLALLAPGAALPQASAQAPRPVRVEDIVVRGNTVLSEQDIAAVTQKYLNRDLDDDALEDLRRELTLAYVNRGYLASGARWADPRIVDGKLTLDVVEGRLVGIDVKEVRVDDQGHDENVGEGSSLSRYVCDRLIIPPGGLMAPPDPHPQADAEVKLCGRTVRLREGPLNVNVVQRRVAELLRDPAIARLNVDIRPGGAPGEAWIDAKVVARRNWDLTASVANDEPPNVGAVHGQIAGTVRNLLGLDEALSLSYGRTAGANFGSARLEVPVTPYDTRIALNWVYNGAGVVSSAFSGLGIRSRYQTAGVAVIQPLMQTEHQILSATLASDYTISDQWMLGEPFSFDPGYVNGQATAAAARATLDYTLHSETPSPTLGDLRWQTLSVRTTLSRGLNMLGVTNAPLAPNADFVSLLAQGQYTAQFGDRLQLLSRGLVQFASQPLFSFEQVSLGGPGTVRGYVQNALIRDDAVIGSLEVRATVTHWPLPGPFSGASDGAIELCPFVDAGRGWDHSPQLAPMASLAGVGVGLQWEMRAGLTARIDYGYALIHPKNTPDALQPLSFNVVAQF